MEVESQKEEVEKAERTAADKAAHRAFIFRSCKASLASLVKIVLSSPEF